MFDLVGEFWEAHVAVAADDSKVLEMPTANAFSIVAAPGGVGTAKVQYSLSSLGDIRNDNATWVDWPEGSVSSVAIGGRETPVRAIKLVASTAPADFDIQVKA